MIRRLLLAVGLLAGAVAPARAATCSTYTQVTGAGGFTIRLPKFNTSGDIWGQCIIDAFATIASSGVVNSTTTSAFLKELYVSRIGGIPSPANIRISSNAYSDTDAWLQVGGTLTVKGNAFSVGSTSFSVSGSKIMVNTSSVPARQMIINGLSSDSLSGTCWTRKLSDDPQQQLCLWHSGGVSGAHFEVEDLSRALSSGSDALFSNKGNDGTRNNLFIKGSNGNVGIGTTSPDQKLHISGSADTYLVIEGQGANTQDRGIEFQGASGATAGYLIMQPNTIGTDSKMQFFVGGGAGGDLKMVINDDGQVGIGNTSPSYKLDVGDGARIWGEDATDGLFLNVSGSTDYRFGEHGSGIDTFRFGPSAANGIFHNFSSGNVGISTGAPTQKLEVTGTIYSNSGGFKFPDGTTQVTAATATEASSAAVRMTGVSWGSVGLVARSTLTISGSTITIHASMSVTTAGSGNTFAGYLIDGRCPDRYTCSSTCASNVTPWKTNNDTNSYITLQARETVASGSHTVSIWVCNDAGTTAAGTSEFWIEAK